MIDIRANLQNKPLSFVELRLAMNAPLPVVSRFVQCSPGPNPNASKKPTKQAQPWQMRDVLCKC